MEIRRQTRLFVLTFALTLVTDVWSQPIGDDASVPNLSSDTDIATAGYFQLQWNADEPVRLLESTDMSFDNAHIAYEGSDSGHTVSGRRDGTLYYRLESVATGATLGQPVRVEIAHHSRSRAFAFFAVGGVVFLATLGLIVFGSRGYSR